jgi:diguanylate cyclase (GGDEF)-like protein/PAS domain S-box-containing protein
MSLTGADVQFPHQRAAAAGPGPPMGIDLEVGYRELVDSLVGHAVFLLDPQGVIQACNAGAQSLVGYRPEEIVGGSFAVLYPPEAVVLGHPQAALEIAAATGHFDEHAWRMRRDGSKFWASIEISAIRAPSGDLSGFGVVASDLTAYKQAEDQLRGTIDLIEQSARIDLPTGLPNRRAFEESLDRELAVSHRTPRKLTVAIIDLDHFKRVNDVRGHPAGDAVLRQASDAWRMCLRPSDVVARYGGDEFGVIMPDTGVEEAAMALDRLRRVTPAGQTCSVGAAEWDGKQTAGALAQSADAALYEAKTAGRDRVVCRPSRYGRRP